MSRINEDLYPSIKVLYQKCFGLDQSFEEINKKYDTSVFKLKNIGIIAETENKEPAAYYGVFPIVMTYETKDYLIAQSGDTMTSPDHQKKGLFVKLAQLTYHLAEQEGINLVYGFPNENSLPGFKSKLNWVFNETMQKFTISNFTIPLCELAIKFPSIASFYKKYSKMRLSKYIIEPNEENIQCLNNNTSTGFIKKDLNFINYKLRNDDNNLISINNFTILIKPKAHLFIGAVGFFEKERTNSFISTINKLAKILACKKTVITISKNNWLYEYLLEKIKAEESLPIGFFQINNNIDIKKIEFVNADYDTF